MVYEGVTAVQGRMIHTQHFCAKCGSASIRRNGSKKGQPKYQCTACRYQGLFVPAAVRKAAQYAQVDALLSERNSQRSIVQLTDEPHYVRGV